MFSDRDRLIYECPVSKFKYDPLALKRRLLLADPRLNEAFRTYGSTDAKPVDKAIAEEAIVRAGRAAFGFKGIDPQTGQGVGDALVIEAVGAFTKWLRGKDDPAQNGPTSVPCTGCP